MFPILADCDWLRNACVTFGFSGIIIMFVCAKIMRIFPSNKFPFISDMLNLSWTSYIGVSTLVPCMILQSFLYFVRIQIAHSSLSSESQELFYRRIFWNWLTMLSGVHLIWCRIDISLLWHVLCTIVFFISSMCNIALDIYTTYYLVQLKVHTIEEFYNQCFICGLIILSVLSFILLFLNVVISEIQQTITITKYNYAAAAEVITVVFMSLYICTWDFSNHDTHINCIVYNKN